MTKSTMQAGPIYDRKDYAGFFRRLFANILDLLLLVVVYFIGDFAAQLAFGLSERVAVYCFIAWLLLSLAYGLGLRLTEGGTLGYRIMGIRYAYVLEGKPPFTLLGIRALMALYLSWLFFMNNIWILFDEHKQAWHDKVSGFYVVKRRARPIGQRLVKRRVICFFGLTFFVWEPQMALPTAPADADALGRDDARPS